MSAQVCEPEGITATCDLCGWCRGGCQVIKLDRSHQRVALCSHCREDLRRLFGVGSVRDSSEEGER